MIGGINADISAALKVEAGRNSKTHSSLHKTDASKRSVKPFELPVFSKIPLHAPNETPEFEKLLTKTAEDNGLFLADPKTRTQVRGEQRKSYKFYLLLPGEPYYKELSAIIERDYADAKFKYDRLKNQKDKKEGHEKLVEKALKELQLAEAALMDLKESEFRNSFGMNATQAVDPKDANRGKELSKTNLYLNEEALKKEADKKEITPESIIKEATELYGTELKAVTNNDKKNALMRKLLMDYYAVDNLLSQVNNKTETAEDMKKQLDLTKRALTRRRDILKEVIDSLNQITFKEESKKK